MNTEYKPITGVWEITMGCNMSCKHCGSSCANALEDQLSTAEALKLCDDLQGLGFQWITLSGGEPTTRKDWDQIARRLYDNGIIPNMITNGWLMNDELVNRAKLAGINTIAMSLDGLENTHDFIRKKGSYDKVMKAIDVLVSNDQTCSIITTVSRANIKELDEMHDILSKKGIYGWQLQYGLPMENMAQHSDMVAEPYIVDELIDFAYRAIQKGGIDIQLADCVGYYNKKEIAVRKKSSNSELYEWSGCGAGKYSIGILHNGDIVGCTSIRDRDFIEGNVKTTPIKEIWEGEESFAWNRNMTKNDLKGVCKKCIYGNTCLGGCGNTRLTMEGSIYSENRYCSYNGAVKKAEEQLRKESDLDRLILKAKKFIDNEAYQLAEIVLSQIHSMDKENDEALTHYGYVTFMLGNYQDACNANNELMTRKPNDPYVNKGIGLSYAKLGEVEKGIDYLKRSIQLSGNTYMDPYYDLAIVYYDNSRVTDAIDILEKGRVLSEDFKNTSEELYLTLKSL